MSEALESGQLPGVVLDVLEGEEHGGSSARVRCWPVPGRDAFSPSRCISGALHANPSPATESVLIERFLEVLEADGATGLDTAKWLISSKICLVVACVCCCPKQAGNDNAAYAQPANAYQWMSI